MLLIKNGIVIDPANNVDGMFDILIEDKLIKEVSPNIEASDCEVIDAAGMIVVPGLVDMHVHLRDPGFEYKEDIISGTLSAVRGGVTSVVCMPNTKPAIDNEAVVKYVIDKANAKGYCNVFPVGCITQGQQGKYLSEIGELKVSGAVAISDDGRPVVSSSLMLNALRYAKTFDIPVISHSEDLELSDKGAMNEGYMSTALGLKGIPSAAESVAIARDILLAECAGARIHIAHVSTRESVDIIRQAKARGVKVTCETAPHYFSLTDEAVEGYDTNAKMNPPLRSADDISAIIYGLKDGTIDVIATDHAPHNEDEKNVEFDNALNGIVGLETSLAVGITYLVKDGNFTINELINKMSYVPAKVLNIDKGTLGVGKAADIAIIDVNEKYTVDVSKFASKGKNSPYNGHELYGVVKHTVVGGKVVV